MRRFYVYSFLNGLQFTWTTWLAFVLARGGNPGWAEAAFHLAILLGEVPTGVVADLLGRRRSMLIGLAIISLMPFGYALIQDTLTACLVLGLSGLAGTFLSGADTALLYETAERKGGEKLARQALARANALFTAALAVAPAAAGLLYQYNDFAPVIGRSVISLALIAVVWGMKEIRHAGAHEERPTIWGHTREAGRVILANRPVLVLIVFAWVYNTSAALTGQFAQAYFPTMGLTMSLTGFVFAAGSGLVAGGSAVAERLPSRTGNAVLRFGPLLLGVAFLGMGLGVGGLPLGLLGAGGAGALWYLLGQAGDGLLYPVYQARFNALLPSAQRATILSFQSAGFSLLMSIAFPAASYLTPVPLIYTVTGAVTCALALLWILRRWKY